MAYTQLKPRHSADARVEKISRESSHYLLSIPAGKADQYRIAQLDDYTQLKRKNFPLHSPMSLSLTARASSNNIPGTWGFGFWNDPFGLSLGFGGNPFRLPALPNAVWFFGASQESYLSFQDPSRASSVPPTDGGSAPPAGTSERGAYIANGFLAQTFRSPRFHPWLVLAGLTLPFSRKMARRFMGKVIRDDGVNLRKDKQQLVPTDWHRYRLDWREKRVSFGVDDALVFESPVSPHPPLGLVIWIDNQYAAFTPEGRIGFGVLENPEPAWLEVKDIKLN